MDTIDILMATYNGERYIKEQIDSILNQTYQNFRLIISDDASSDNTIQILKEYEKKDNRIKVYYQEKNLGYIKNFEFLLKKVENKYYMLSDQDDVWLPEKIQKSIDCLKNTNSDLVYGDLIVVDENLHEINPSFMKLKNTFKKAKKYNDFRAVYLYNCVTGCTILSKKEFIPKILPFPENVSYMPHDYWISLIVAMNGKIKLIDEKEILYRQHGNNQIGSKKMVDNLESFEQIRNLFIDVKLNVFKAYTENNKSFPENLKNLSQDGLKYFQNIKNKKYFNFKNWNVFHKLYKYDNLKYYTINFIIMNMPVFGKFLYKFKKK